MGCAVPGPPAGTAADERRDDPVRTLSRTINGALIAVLALPGALAALSAASPRAAAADGLATQPATSAAAQLPTSAFAPVGPCRLADTRNGDGYSRVDASTIRIAVAGRCGVDPSADSAVLTVTLVAHGADAYASAYEARGKPPESSNVNASGKETRANTAFVALGVNGAVDVLVTGGADLIVDVEGAFVPAEQAAAGRYVGVSPVRLRDTRLATAPARVGVPLARNGRLDVSVGDSVPPGAGAVMVTITTTESAGPGYVTVWDGSGAMPEASVLNTDASGQTRAATVVVPITGGRFSVFSSAGGHVLVDLAGYFTGPEAAPADVGLWVATGGQRVLDTRRSDPLAADQAIEVAVTGGATIVGTLTATQSAGWGYQTAWAAGTSRPETSTLNQDRGGQTVANLVVAAASTRGIGLYTSVGSHLLLDVAGWFTGTPVTSVVRVPTKVPARPSADCTTIGVVGDSLTVGDQTIGGMEAALTGRGWRATIDAAVSRRIPRSATPPLSGFWAISDLQATGFNPCTWLIALGTNDAGGTSVAAYRKMIDEILAQIGKGRSVIWVDAYLARTPGAEVFDGVLSDYEQQGKLRVVRFSSWIMDKIAQDAGYLAADGVHLTSAGYKARTAMIADALGSPPR